MLRKHASASVLEAWRVRSGSTAAQISKAAHRVAFDYDPRPGYLYVRSRMISSRTNDNHDTFPADEIEKGYKSFLGKPVFVNHNNANHRRARGVIVALALHRDRNPDGTPDTWVEGLMEIDAVRFPRLARAIIDGKVNRTSMGVDVEWSSCSACGNKATSPAEYCRHLPAMKGKRIRKRNLVTGKVEERLIHEICAGLSFFENSLLVEDPADPTAYLLGDVDTRGLSKAASTLAARRRKQDWKPVRGYGRDPRFDGVALKRDRNGFFVHTHRARSDSYPSPEDIPAAEVEQIRSSGSRHASREPDRFSGDPTHCASCGHPLESERSSPDAGNWRSAGMPFLCNDCAHGPQIGPPSRAGKLPPLFYRNSGGYAARPSPYMQPEPGMGETRPWTEDDAMLSSLSSRHGLRQKAKPGDHQWFRDHPVSSAHILDAWHDSTDDEKAQGKRWYSDAHHVAKAIASGDAALGAGLLSAYSPQTAWPVNMFNASRAMTGDPPGPGSGAMGMQQRAAMRILSGEHHSSVLKGPKTAAFAHLIEHGGDTEEDERHGRQKVVIDRHAMSVAVGRRLSKEEGSKAPIDDPGHYEHVAHAYREAAHILSRATGKKISPHQVQAVTWMRQVRKNKQEDETSRGGGGKGRVRMQDNARPKWEHHHRLHHPEGIDPENMHYHGKRKLAYGETRVPPQVDTLRMEECPVCGERDVWSGDRCPVCGFIVPPSMFRDPDTSKAQQVRDELDEQGEVVAQPGDDQAGSGDDADEQLLHPDQVAPDGVPDVQGEDESPMATDGQPPPGEEKAQGEEEAQGEEDGEEPPGDLQGGGDLMCPECGSVFPPDLGAQPGVPCPACGQGALEPAGGPQKDQEAVPGDDAEDEEDERDDDMAGTKTAATAARAQAHRIAVLAAENDVLRAQLNYLATAAGVDRQLGEIRRNVLRRHGDLLNPASPIPDPPQGPAAETTEQALAPGAMDDPSRPGSTPGANAGVPAAQTTTAITPGVEMQTAPASQLIDVTAPIAGTNPSQDGGVPIEQRRIETDVRIDPDPLKASGPGIGGQGANGAAFPWLLGEGAPGQQPQGQGQRAASRQGGQQFEAASAARTFASIRLAKLRIQAGLEHGEELSIAERIEKDASLPYQLIEHEIGILARMPAQRQQGRQPMQRAAARSAPSLASVGAAHYAPAAMAADDLDGSDIFLD